MACIVHVLLPTLQQIRSAYVSLEFFLTTSLVPLKSAPLLISKISRVFDSNHKNLGTLTHLRTATFEFIITTCGSDGIIHESGEEHPSICVVAILILRLQSLSNL